MATTLKPSEKTPCKTASPPPRSYNAMDHESDQQEHRQKKQPTHTLKTKCRIICDFLCWPIFITITLILIGIQLTESGLVLYKRTQLAMNCTIDHENSNDTGASEKHDKSTHKAGAITKQELDIEYDFYYLGGYGTIVLLRLLNFFLLGRGIWHLIRERAKDPRLQEILTVRNLCCSCVSPSLGFFSTVILLLFTAGAAAAYFALGISIEKTYADSLKDCIHYSTTVYIVTCFFNLFTHLIYVGIVMTMMAAGSTTEKMLQIVDQDEEQGTCKVKDLDGDQAQKEYDDNGRRIRVINGVFEGWFLVSLVILLIKLKIPEAYQRLRPWVLNHHATPHTELYEVVHLIFQALLAITLFATAKTFTHAHKTYFRNLKASAKSVQEDDRNIFTPRIGKVDIPLNITFSIFFTLAGFMVTLGDSFLVQTGA